MHGSVLGGFCVHQCHVADAVNTQQTFQCVVFEQVPNGMMVPGNGMVPMANQNPHMPGMIPIMQSPQMPPAMQGRPCGMSARPCFARALCLSTN